MKQFIKNNIKGLFAFVVAICLFCGVAVAINSNSNQPKQVLAEVVYTLPKGWSSLTSPATKDTIEILSFKNLSSEPSGYEATVSITDGIYGTYKTLDSGNYDLVIWANGTIYAPENCSYFFSACSSLTEIDFSNFNTSNVTSMTGMFAHCSSLTRLYMPYFNTEKVKRIDSFIDSCVSLVELDLSSFNLCGLENNTGKTLGAFLSHSSEQIKLMRYKTPYTTGAEMTLWGFVAIEGNISFVRTDGTNDFVNQGTVKLTANSVELVRHHSITYKDEGNVAFSGINSANNVNSFGYGETVTLHDPEKAGYTFNGWYLTSDCSGTAITKFNEQSCLNNVNSYGSFTLYAKWTANRYTITWKNYNGTVLETDTNVLAGTTPVYNGATPVREDGGYQYLYTFKGWSPAVGAITGDTTYVATFTQTIKTYTITWANYDGTVLEVDEVEYWSVPTYDDEEPTRTGDAQYSYKFCGWDKTIEKAYKDNTYTACFTRSTNIYTITWKGDDGVTTLATSNVAYGNTPRYPYGTPTKAGDEQYSYSFYTWWPEIQTVTGDATYRAQFARYTKAYTITWENEDGTVLETDTWVEYGTTPEYNGETPTKNADAQYTYTFSGWDPEITAVTGNATYTATYTKTVNTYKITWLNYNGSTLATSEVEYGETPVYTGETPTRAADAEHTYMHNGWTPEIEPVNGNATYVATYYESPVKYLITFNNWDNTLLGSWEFEYGQTPNYQGLAPTRAEDAQFTYAFAGWNPEISAVTGSATYTAQFTEMVRKYTITWVDGNGTTLKTDEVEYGQTPVYTGATPTKEADAQYTYSFSHWGPTIVSVTGNATYIAQFSETVRSYTIIFKNENGQELQTKEFEYGALPTYTGTTPTMPKDAQYTYTFKEWYPTRTAVTGNATYTATYTKTINKYTIKWVNEGKEVEVDENVPYGETPEYNGKAPTKAETAQYKYTFNGWTPAITAVTGNATYTAKYSETIKKYTITWVDGNDAIIKTDEVEYGQTPVYTGATPTKEADAQYTYSFNGWNPVISVVTGDATYKATYTETINKYTIKWVIEGKEAEVDENVPYGETPEYNGKTPTKEPTYQYEYIFVGWAPDITSVTGNATYTAKFDIEGKCTIIFQNDDGTTLQTVYVVEGETPEYTGLEPTKDADAQYTYTFAGWDKQIVTATGDEVYTATYTKTVNKYIIKWVNEGAEVEVDENVPYGETPEYNGKAPTKEATEQYSYTFNGWTPAVSAVTGNATYTATFNEVLRKYTITWVDGNGETIKAEEVEYGKTPFYTGANPTKEATEQYTYTFSGWNPAVSAVTGNATYTAQFEHVLRKYIITWVDGNDATIKTDEVEYGKTPVYTGAIPTKASTAQYTYTFSHWGTVVSVTGNATYIAQFNQTIREYRIIFKNGETVLQDSNVAYGQMPSYEGTPTQTGTAQYTYTFSGWTPQLAEVTGEAIYSATFTSTVNKYKITWVNYDGTKLYENDFDYGSTPVYEGSAPTKPSTQNCTYSFNGWNPSIQVVTQNAIYHAVYSEVMTYSIVWQNYNGQELYRADVASGVVPQYVGATPTRPSDEQYTYTFNGWTPTVSAATQNAIYTATYTQAVNKYMVTVNYILNDNITSTKSYLVAYGESFIVPNRSGIKITEVMVNDLVVEFEEKITVNSVKENTTINIYYEEAQQEQNMLLIIVIAVASAVVLIVIVVSIIIVKKNNGKRKNESLKSLQSAKMVSGTQTKETLASRPQSTGTVIPKAPQQAKKLPSKQVPTKRPPKLPKDQ